MHILMGRSGFEPKNGAGWENRTPLAAVEGRCMHQSAKPALPTRLSAIGSFWNRHTDAIVRTQPEITGGYSLGSTQSC